MILLNQNKILLSRVFLLKYNRDKTKLKKLGSKIGAYHNSLIDRIVLDDYDWEDKKEQDKISKTLLALNLIPVTEYFRQITYNNVLSSHELSNINKAKYAYAEKITLEQKDLFWSNFNQIGELVNTHKIEKPIYREVLKETPQIKRADLLRMASDQGINQDLLTNVWSIRNPDLLSRNLYREAQMDTEYQSAFMNADMNYKTWVWSEAENTRHSNMDGDTVAIDEYFNVLNEVTGEEDEMLYPHDPNGSPGNVINCLCDVLYLEKEPDPY